MKKPKDEKQEVKGVKEEHVTQVVNQLRDDTLPTEEESGGSTTT